VQGRLGWLCALNMLCATPLRAPPSLPPSLCRRSCLAPRPSRQTTWRTCCIRPTHQGRAAAEARRRPSSEEREAARSRSSTRSRRRAVGVQCRRRCWCRSHPTGLRARVAAGGAEGVDNREPPCAFIRPGWTGGGLNNETVLLHTRWRCRSCQSSDRARHAPTHRARPARPGAGIICIEMKIFRIFNPSTRQPVIWDRGRQGTAAGGCRVLRAAATMTGAATGPLPACPRNERWR
jgi:hypothetical protein